MMPLKNTRIHLKQFWADSVRKPCFPQQNRRGAIDKIGFAHAIGACNNDIWLLITANDF